MNHWLLRIALAAPFIVHGIAVISHSYGFDLYTVFHVLSLAACAMILWGGYDDIEIGGKCITFIGSVILAAMTVGALVISHMTLLVAIPLLGISLYLISETK